MQYFRQLGSFDNRFHLVKNKHCPYGLCSSTRILLKAHVNRIKLVPMKLKICLLALGCIFQVVSATYAQTTNQVFGTGSYIINMGAVPQTFSNGLRPYGFVYELLNTYKVPVAWVVNPAKSKDGVDFTHNGVQYRGGAFIIPAEFRTTAVNNAIALWQSRGVLGASTVAEITLPVYKTRSFAPRGTLDKSKGSIAAAYFTNASSPPAAFGGFSSNGWKNPSQLAACDDIFVLPHADPTWSTHNNLYSWNLNYQGNICSACHAVSELENISDAGTGIRMNFLSTNGLLLDNQHADGSPPYSYTHSEEPVMQFMGAMDQAVVNGSEQIYLPRPGSAWRPGVKVGVFDPTQSDVPSRSPGQAAIVAFGRAFDDANRGYVMYEGGHDHNKDGTIQFKVAAQRAFFNFSYFSNNEKNAWYTINLLGLPPNVAPGNPVTLTLQTPPEMNLSEYTIQWTSGSSGGSFSSTTAATVTYTPPAIPVDETIVISVTISDLCNRQSFSSASTVVSNLLASSGIKLSGRNGTFPSLSWQITTAAEIQRFEIERSADRAGFLKVGEVLGQTAADWNFEDPAAGNNRNYYRIKAITTSGKTLYSNIIQLQGANGTANNSLVIYPNPIRRNGTIQCQFNSSGVDQLTITVVDMNGKRLFSHQKAVSKGMNSFSLSAGNIPAGTFMIQAVSANGEQNQFSRLVITP